MLDHGLADHGQRHLEQTLVAVELGLAFVFINLEWQELIEHEVRTLDDDLTLLHIELDLAEFGIW